MKNKALNLVLCVAFIALLSNCSKKDTQTANQQETNPQKISFMEAGRLKAASLSLKQQHVASVSNEMRMTLKEKQTALLKKAGLDSLLLLQSQVKGNAGLKSAQLFKPYHRLMQIESYASNYYPDAFTYFTYDGLSRLLYEDYYSDYDQDGNYTYNGYFQYSYPGDFANVLYVDHFDGNSNWDYYYEYYYSPLMDGTNYYDRLTYIAKWTSGGTFINWNWMTWNTSAVIIGNVWKSSQNVILGSRAMTYDYTHQNFSQVTGYDANGNFSYVENYTYNDVDSYPVDHSKIIKKKTVSARYNGAMFDYFHNQYNADVVCYNSLKADGSFNSAYVYRYDTDLEGNYDPFDHQNFFNFR